MPTLELHGCTPEPLMNYLKALGLLRLISEQKDARVRGAWKDGVFLIQTESLDAASVLEFFREEYAPSAIVAPWGARSGFYPGSSENSAREALGSINEDSHARFSTFREAVGTVGKLLKELNLEVKAADEQKLRLLQNCRARLPDSVLAWLDTCFVLTGVDRRFPPLLGTGGNEGSGSYVSGFAQAVVECLIRRSQQEGLRTALFGTPGTDRFGGPTPGHFSPDAAGGPNAGQGFHGPQRTNAWDYLLCLEGTLLLAGAVSRRMEATEREQASFPFTVRSSPAGFGSASEPESADARGEIWLPLWSRFISAAEARALFAEGRAEVSGKQAKSGVDFSRAVAGLGVDRGIRSFARFGFLRRSGRTYLAASLGRFNVEMREDVDLLREVDTWLDRFRAACREETAPARFKSSLRRIETTIFDFCRYGGAARFANILRALGNAERHLASGEKFRSNDRRKILPLDGLSAQWVTAGDDGGTEFKLALGLAGIGRGRKSVSRLRGNIEPVKELYNRFDWADRAPGVVWSNASLPANLAAVLARRVMDAGREGAEVLPLNSGFPVGLSAVAAFIGREVDDDRVEELLWGMLAVKLDDVTHHAKSSGDASVVPRPYALLKLLFLPFALKKVDGTEVHVRAESDILALLRGGHVAGACKVAMRRLRSAGFEPLPHRKSGGGNRDDEWEDAAGVDAGRLAGALLLPISEHSAGSLLRLITRDPKKEVGEMEETASEL